MTDISHRIAGLSPEKRALLESRLLERAAVGTSASEIVRQARSGAIPLSFAQQRLWFLDQLQPGSTGYNVHDTVRLCGTLDLSALEKALSEIVRRHEILRTRFETLEGTPVQVVDPPLPWPLPVVALAPMPEAEREAEAERLATEEAGRPFELARGPLFRTMLLRISEKDHVLLMTVHHIVADGWSLGILRRELGALYEAFSAGRPSPLPELPVQYADFAIWQRQWLQGDVLKAQLDYWKNRLEGLPVLQLPTDRPRPPVQTDRGERISFRLSDGLAARIRELAQSQKSTVFMTLLATFKAAIFAQTRQEDSVVGTDLANRNRVEFEGLIGCFVNHLVMRTSLAGNPTFRDVLRRVRETALGAYAHQDFPFQKLVEHLQPKRSLGQTPLFQVLFVLQNAPMESLQLRGLTLRPMTLDGELAKFDLALFLEESPSGLAGTWVYRTDLFHSATVSDLSADFEMLLDIAVAAPDTRLDELPRLAAAKRSESIAVRRRSSGAEKLRMAREESVGARE